MKKIVSILRQFSKKFSRKGLYEWLINELRQIPGNKPVVLNIGAAGPVPALVRNIPRFKMINLDISADKNPDIVADACDMKAHVEDNSIDAVVLMEVMEHIPSPERALAEIHRVLKPGGVLLGSTPFLFPIHAAPYDYFRYTPYGLRHVLRNYTIVEIKPRNNYGEAIAVLLVRQFNGKKPIQLAAGLLAFGVGLVLYPLLYAIARISGLDLGATGYVWKAIKK